ncbi:hypothetical protein ACG1BZ_07115 [Microbulbifer sp. CNSA002]|uniref:hypothetical protein n=1 Tax=Microbulbifer sp. CNSA002 TaxID=3373604 RepID=UPI0039B6073F
MGSYVFEFLNDSLILDESLIRDNYYGISEKEISKELSSYRDHCLKNIDNIGEVISSHDTNLSCLGSQSITNEDDLKRSALYVDQMIIPDPIFPFTTPESEISNTFSSMLGMGSNGEIDRRGLSLAAQKVISMRPMVAGSFIKFFPVSLLSEPPMEIPGGYSEVGFSDLLPSPIMDFFVERATVKSLQRTEEGLIVGDTLDLCREIGVQFNGQKSSDLEIYNLLEKKILSFNENDGTYKFAVIQPESPPDKEQFDLWVRQSIHRSAYEFFVETSKRIQLSHHLNSAFTCASPLESSLLSENFFDTKSGIKENTANCILNMELPFLERISSSDLMSLRMNDGEEFHNFRIELESKLRELRHETSPEVIKGKIEDIEHEMFDVQVQKINAKISSVRGVALADSGIAFAGLAAGFATSGASLIGTFAALLHGAKSFTEYQEKVKENPCYFAWKLKNKTQNSLKSNTKKKSNKVIKKVRAKNSSFVK